MRLQAVSNIINGKHEFVVMKATQLARVLGVRLDWLLEGTEPKERAL